MARVSVFTDNFNRSNSDTIGTGWNETYAYGGSSGGDLDIVSNTLKCTSVGNNTNAQRPIGMCTTQLSSDDNYCEAKVIGTSNQYLIARADSPTTPNYFYLANFRVGNDDIYVERYGAAGDGYTSQANQQFSSITINDGDTISMEVETVSASEVDVRVYVNDVLKGTYQDTNAARVTTGRYAGVWGKILNMAWDDFECGYLGEATTSTSTTTTSTSSSTTTTSTSTSSSTSTTTTSTSSSTSTSTSTVSTTTSTSSSTSTTTTSTSSSTSTTTTTTINPLSGGLSFGEQNPTDGETATSWQTWVTTGEIVGDPDWGKLALDLNELGYSQVYDYGNANERTYTLTKNKYGTGQGGRDTLQIRGSADSFTADDEIVEWENYDIPISRLWRYVQVRVADQGKYNIATTTVNEAHSCIYPWQRKVIEALDLIWVFYTTTSGAMYKVSADGVTWSAEKTLRALNDYSGGHYFNMCFDGTYFHFVYTSDITAGNDVEYQRATPDSNGDLTLDTVRTVLSVATNESVKYGTIFVDSNGYPWIGYVKWYGDYTVDPKGAYVTKSTTKDGTWTTASGFPYTLIDNITSANHPVPTGLPLSNGDTYWMYIDGLSENNPLYGKLWDSSESNWGTEETIYTNVGDTIRNQVIDSNNNIHVFYKVADSGMYYKRKDGGTGTWSDGVLITSTVAGHVSMSVFGVDCVRFYWQYPAGTYWYKRKIGDIWDDSIQLFSGGTPQNTLTLQTIEDETKESVFINKILVYLDNNTSPYQLKIVINGSL